MFHQFTGRTAILAAVLALACTSPTIAQNSDRPSSAGDLRGDLEIFARQIIADDHSFSEAARVAADARVHALRAALGDITALQFEVELCRIAALANNVHTGCWRGPPAAPIVAASFYPLQGGIYVFQTDDANADLIGGRLLAIDGRPVEAVRSEVRSLAGGRDGWRDSVTAYAYSRPAILNALGVTRRADEAVYRIRTSGGSIVERRLVAGQPRAMTRFIVAPDQAPWILREQADFFRWRDAPEHGAVIVQLRTNLDQGGRSLAAFLQEVERRCAALGRKVVILDLRSGDGGDMTLSRAFFAALPASIGPDGRFLVLVGPRTISAGLANAAYLKQSGGRTVTILGESPGDGLTFFSEGHDVRLPDTGLVMQNALERDDLKDGCRPYADCFAGLAQPNGPTATPIERAPYIKRMPVSVASLEPDVPAPVRAADYLAGRDAGLIKALNLALPCVHAAHREACEAENSELAGPVGRSRSN